MIIETNEQYQAALEQLNALGDAGSVGPDQDEFFAISTAMVEYETRSHIASTDGDGHGN